jgi:hypothetical protein
MAAGTGFLFVFTHRPVLIDEVIDNIKNPASQAT